MKKIAGMLCGALLSVLAGCASVPMGSDAEDMAAKSFSPRQGKANIYVYRNEIKGAAWWMPLSLNGRLAGRTAAKTYFLFEVDPGNHRLVSHTENTSELAVDASAGQNYYVWQEVKTGVLKIRSNLQLMDEAAGRAGVMECKRAQASF